MTDSFVLTLQCPDRPGLIFAVSGWVANSGGNILDAQQFTEIDANKFFMRTHFDFPEMRNIEELRSSFAKLAAENEMEFKLVVAEAPMRTLIMVSKQGHCLNDLLFRQSIGALNIEVPAIVSNHRDLERLAQSYDIDFHHIPVTKENKEEAEAQLLELVTGLEIDLVVLARYMQILSDNVANQLSGKVINIHHSFLPSFKGARPYHQAHDRGVKLIGATAHYVTAALDEGPIIDQGVTRVDHNFAPADLARAGQDVESQTLARAVKLHSESRVLMNGPRTVVFD